MKLIVTLVFLALATLVMSGANVTSACLGRCDSAPIQATTPDNQPGTLGPQDPKGSRTMPGNMVLDDPVNKVTRFAGDKGKAPFDHAQHVAAGDACVTCHHTNSKTLTKAVEEDVQKCGACHKEDDEVSNLEGSNEDRKFRGKMAHRSEAAFHGLGDTQPDRLAGCIDCHKARAETVKKAADKTACFDCHVRAQR